MLSETCFERWGKSYHSTQSFEFVKIHQCTRHGKKRISFKKVHTIGMIPVWVSMSGVCVPHSACFTHAAGTTFHLLTFVRRHCVGENWRKTSATVFIMQLRVPTAPGKPGKTGPDLENLEILEKQGVWGQKPGKILQNLEFFFDLILKKPKSLNKKVSEKI